MVEKQRMLDNLQAKIDIIDHKVKGVIELFKPLVSRGDSFLLGRKRTLADSRRVYGNISPS